ncbi:MAG: hypothetical protein A2051_08745 [Desulfovibrionales bacterium GWA2_65_9]|nr:MAG: hypothetical protein A2051_08745 [Desulfovibrionales bacterium GWA2_65_9]
MLKHLRKAGISGVMTLVPMLMVLLLAPDSPAAARKSASDKAIKAEKAPVPKPAPTEAAFELWLKKYGAYDRIVLPEPEKAGQDADANVLKRAEGLLMQGSPQEALALIEAQPAFEEPAAEAQRLWLGAQAHRALGDPYKAVIWYNHAAKLMDGKARKERLAAEPGLESLWVDVWRRQFWAFVGAPPASSEALQGNLRSLLDQAETAWGPQNFWIKSKEALALATGEAPPAPLAEAKDSAKDNATPSAKTPAKDKDAPLSVTSADRQRIAEALAAASLEDFARARTALAGLPDPALKDFWMAMVAFMETGKPHDTKTLRAAGYAKAAGFWSANLLAPFAASRDTWFLGSTSSQSWTKFRNNITQLPNLEARAAVDKELQSLLLSEDMSRLLRSLKFVLLVEGGDLDGARETWEGLDKRKLPLSLRLSGGLLTQEDVRNLLPQEIGAAAKLSPALRSLLAAAGTGTALIAEAPFWTRAEVGRSSTVNKVWPLDRLLVLADWQARWDSAPGPELARRSAFLFPDTAYGYDCLTYLTRKAIEGRYFQLAGTYLNRMHDMSTDKAGQAVRLGLKAKMERDSGKDAEALESYQALNELGVDLDPKTRLDMATFLQLKNDFTGGRKQLLLLWGQRESLSRPLQAEVLFWLGEGEHSLRNYDAALDFYLRLAYEYPKEPMWPTVAMYRAAMIYELKGNFEPAKKFLHAVIATADTKEAKEAARNRLNALEAKSGKPTSAKDGPEAVYPF